MSWKKIKGYKNLYEVSNTGFVRSVDRMVFNGKGSYFKEGKNKSRCMGKRGYLHVALWKNNSVKVVKVHRLVATHFLKYSRYKEVNHKDGDKLNNHVNNLEWCSRSQNMQHASDIGLKGKIDKKERCIILNRLYSGESQAKIAKDYNVSRSAIYYIKKIIVKNNGRTS